MRNAFHAGKVEGGGGGEVSVSRQPVKRVVAPPAVSAHKPKLPAEQRLDVRLLHLADRLLARVWHQTVVLKRYPLPKSGPAILVCNHTSGLDPFLIQSV